MGLFDINMPMMYGEGRKAFLRLQDEIVKQTQDDSLFARRSSSEQSASEAPYRGLFASSPKEFASDVTISPFSTSMTGATTVMGGGRVSLHCTVYRDGGRESVLGLKCYRGTDQSKVVGIEVVEAGAGNFLRTRPSELILRPHKYIPTFESVILVVLWVEPGPKTGPYEYYFGLEKTAPDETTEKFLAATRPAAVSEQQQITCGWATISVRGSHQEVEGHRMFSRIRLTESAADVRAELETRIGELETERLEELRVRKAREKHHECIMAGIVLVFIAIFLLC